jgi:D-sedoheptulose 7-phosphate isomerase
MLDKGNVMDSPSGNIFQDHLDILLNNMDSLPDSITPATELIVSTILNDRKIFSCGNGFGGTLAQLFCQQLLNQMNQERPALPAFCLNDSATTISGISHKYKFNEVYSRQVRALGLPGDCLVIIDSNQQYSNLNAAIQTAHDRDMSVIVIHPHNSQNILSLLDDKDIAIGIECDNPAVLLQIELLVITAINNSIEQTLFNH